MDTDHTLPSDSRPIITGHFAREGIGLKRKSEKADLEKIAREEYTLDWLQSKVFLVFYLVLQHIWVTLNNALDYQAISDL